MICFDIKLPEPIGLSVLSDAGAFEPEDISDGSLSPGESHEGSQEGCGVLRRSGEGELDSAFESAVFDGVSPSLLQIPRPPPCNAAAASRADRGRKKIERNGKARRVYPLRNTDASSAVALPVRLRPVEPRRLARRRFCALKVPSALRCPIHRRSDPCW